MAPESKLIEWDDDRYSTNIERFDDQHQYLFNLLNELYQAIDNGDPEDEAGDVLRELERYTEYHFGDEEEFMQDCGYSMDCADCFYNHREMHEEFVEKVTDLRERHEQGEHIEMEVLEFVRDWLDSHIAGNDQDQKYSEYYQEEISDDYEYTPGKLHDSREVEAAHPEALQDEETIEDYDVSIGSDIQAGESISFQDEPLAAWFERVWLHHADRTAAMTPDDDTEPVLFGEFRDRARSVAAGLLNSGLEPGDRVGIYADPEFDWSVVDAACHLAGLISVPVSNLFNNDRALHIIDDAGVDVLVAERMVPVSVEQGVETVLQIDDLPTGERENFPGFDRDEDDVATIVYKIGTDKHPRGCALTHRNLLAAINMLSDRLPVTPGGTGTCFLPLGLMYQRVCTYYLWANGNAVAYMDIDDFEDHLQEVRPSVLVGVPQAYERLREELQDRMSGMNGAKKFIAVDVAKEYGAVMRDDRSASRRLSMKHSMAERTVFASLREKTGLDNITHALTSTESIESETLNFFWGLNVPLTEVYESTELTGLATLTAPDDYRAEVVGHPFPGTEVALAEDGEVIVRGPSVMDGYWNDKEATAYAIRDGWYHTGDIGEFTDDGALRIIGSK
ncbi:bacteriohemerythrin [Salinibaculum rarum]|uniref:bacteriohemerythrin n=1 Tax=Salinibaculum rarum TaxID=3058903 RepID=UPI00265F9A81|nr:bacteriohemerythrin [Salinibaculum sp. KK48]